MTEAAAAQRKTRADSTARVVEVVATRDPTAVYLFTPARRVTIELYAKISGRTPKSIRRKIETGRWLQGREYHRDPDGSVMVDVRGVEAWEQGETATG